MGIVYGSPEIRTPVEPAERTPEEKKSFLEIAGPAFRRENSIVSMYEGMRGSTDPRYWEVDYDYKPDVTGYEEYATEFISADNKYQENLIKARLDKEIADDQALYSSGAKGVAAMMAAGVLDPMFLFSMAVPGGAFVGGSKTLQAGKAAWGALAGTAATEFALQASQLERTAGQSVVNIGAGVLIAGALGAMTARIPKDELTELTERVSAAHKSGGAAATEFGAENADFTIARGKKVMERLRQLSPAARHATTVGKTPHLQLQEMTGAMWSTEASKIGVSAGPPVHHRVVTYDAMMFEALESIHQLRKGTGMSASDFHTAIFHAMNNGDVFDGSVAAVNDAVTKSAQHLRKKIYDPIKKWALETGILDEADIENLNVISYLNRLYRLDRISAAEPEKFRALLVKHLRRQAKSQEAKAQKVSDDIGARDKVRAKREAAVTGWKTDLEGLKTGRAKLLTAQKKARGKNRQAIDKQLSALEAKIAKLRQGIKDAESIPLPGERQTPVRTYEEGEIEGIAQDIVNKMTRSPLGAFGQDVVPKAGFLKDRTLNFIPQDELSEWLETDIERVMGAYIHQMAPDIELARKWGGPDSRLQIDGKPTPTKIIEALKKEIDDEYNELLSKAEGKTYKKLEREANQAKIDIEAMIGMLKGTYKLPADASSALVKLGRGVREVNYLRLLGEMTAAAAPDVPHIMMKFGTWRSLNMISKFATNFGTMRAAMKEVKRMGTALDMTQNTRANILAEIGGSYGYASKIAKLSQGASQTFTIATLMAPWNAVWKQFTGLMSVDKIYRTAKKIASGTATKADEADIERLAQLGIGKGKGAVPPEDIVQQFEKWGREDGGLWLAQIDDWDNASAHRGMQSAVVMEVNGTIVTPDVGDLPLITRSELGKSIFQFKSFGFSATNKVFHSGIQDPHRLSTLNGAILMLAMGGMVYTVREKLAGRKPVNFMDDPGKFLLEAFDRSGLSGILMDFHNTIEGATRGSIGINRLMGAAPMSRYASRNWVGSVGGPAIGAVSDTLQAGSAMALGKYSESDVHAARRLIPFQNVFYLRGIFDEFEAAVAKRVVNE